MDRQTYLEIARQQADEKELRRRAAIVKLRGEGKTLQFIGDLFGVSRERIRQILEREAKAANASAD